jgi:Ca2+-binding RTX toxin-like protein
MATQYGTVGADKLTGGGGDDILSGAPQDNPGADTGNDVLKGLNGRDTLRGFGGDDWLDGGSGDDVMQGDAGNDTYVVNRTTDQVIEAANAGYDTVLSSVNWSLLPATGSLGTIEALTLTGTADLSGTGNSLANRITGNAGNNTLLGMDGNDTLLGGDGNDVLDGGTGLDVLDGGLGDDIYVISALYEVYIDHYPTYRQPDIRDSGGLDMMISAVSGFDFQVQMAEGIEILLMRVAGDYLGNALDNTMNGSAGSDILSGGGGADVLNGGDGDDYLTGEYMVGGAGDDTFYITALTDVLVERSGGGIDTVSTAFNKTISRQFENLELTGDNIIGRGNSGDNVITSTGAHNFLRGLEGNDTLRGGGEGDRLYGGVGDDTYFWTPNDTIIELAGEGYDTLRIDSANDFPASKPFDVTIAAGVEKLYSTSSLLANATGNNEANDMELRFGGKLLRGLGGDDVLRGGSNGMTIEGGSGNDVLWSDGARGVTLDGGTGDDVMTSSGPDTIFIVDSAADVVQGTGTVRTAMSYSLAESSPVNLELTAAATGTGNSVANRLTGSAGADRLSGLGGNDTLIGGLGADLLSGGEGIDRFTYAKASEGGDTLLDFTGGLDELHVSAAGFGGGLFVGISLEVTGRYVANAAGTATSAAGTGQFVMNTTTDTLWWDSNGKAAGGATMLAHLDTPADFSAQDIFVGL